MPVKIRWPVPSDIEIAQEAELLPITEIASRAGIREDELELYGRYMVKIDYTKVLARLKDRPDGKLICVTAITPTPLGEGKIEGAANDTPRRFVPYSALMYVSTGDTFVYTSPKPRTFVRQAVNIDYIADNVAVLKEGPPVGTEVVTVGAAELFGAEAGAGGAH